MQDDNAIATVGDVKRAVRDFTVDRFESIDRRFDRVNEDIDRILDIVIRMDNRLKQSLEGYQSHEKRIVQLEQHNGLIAA